MYGHTSRQIGKNTFNPELVGGFNHFEKYLSKLIISPSRDENKKYLKPPPSELFQRFRSGFSDPITTMVGCI